MRLKQGDDAAFEDLWNSLRPMFVDRIFPMVPKHLWPDFESELMERLWMGTRSFRPEEQTRVSTWAQRLARNLALSFVKRKWLADDMVRRAARSDGTLVPVDSLPSPPDLDLDIDQLLQDLRDALLASGERGEFRVSIFDLLVESGSVKDVAAALGRSRFNIYTVIQQEIMPIIRRELSWMTPYSKSSRAEV